MPMTVISSKKKNKRAQYAIMGGVGVTLVGIWICLPLMNSSSLDSGTKTNFVTKKADMRNLGGDIQLEGQAPGQALTGEMINNPAMSAQAPSGLYQSGTANDAIRFDEAQMPAAGGTSSGSGVSSGGSGGGGASSGGGASGGGSASSAVGAGKGKLASMPGLGGTSGGSSSASAPVNSQKQFGSGSAKNDFSPVANLPKGGKTDGKLMQSLKNTSALGDKAAAAKAMDASKGLASSAFDGGNVKNANLNTGLEQDASQGAVGLSEAMDQTIANLKANDKTLDNKKYNIPKPTETEADEEDEFAKEILKMVLQTAISSMLGPVFGAIGQAMAVGINSNWKAPKS